jgi:hypothetical protein
VDGNEASLSCCSIPEKKLATNHTTFHSLALHGLPDTNNTFPLRMLKKSVRYELRRSGPEHAERRGVFPELPILRQESGHCVKIVKFVHNWRVCQEVVVELLLPRCGNI